MTMFRNALYSSCLLLLFSTPSALAGPLADHWQGGDLIFQETEGPEADMLKRLTGNRLTHVGILRASGGGPIVVEATRAGDVYETDLDVFLERGVGKNYAIYRVKGLVPPDDWYHPLVLAATDFFNTPYDVYYSEGASAIYNSELIYLSAKAIGVELGHVRRLEDLVGDDESARSFFLENWRAHPECGSDRLTKLDCWSVVKKQAIITPDLLLANDRLELIVSTFEPGR